MLAEFESSKILIVGGAGFVGSNLAHYLCKSNPSKIFIVDNLISSDVTNLPKSDFVEFIYGSINKQEILYRIPKDIGIITQQLRKT